MAKRGSWRGTSSSPAVVAVVLFAAITVSLWGWLITRGSDVPSDPEATRWLATHDATLAEEPDPPVVAMLGDSYVNGSNGISRDETFSALAATNLGWDYQPFGAPGIGYSVESPTGDAPIPHYVEDVVQAQPDVVIVEGGMNDIGRDSADTRTGAAQTFRQLRTGLPGVRIIVIGPFTRGDLTPANARATRDAVRSAADDVEGVTFIDALGWYTSPAQINSDGVHLSETGLQDYAKLFEQAVGPLVDTAI